MTVQKDGSVLYAVYGTLREGWGNNRLLQNEGVELLGQMRTPASYNMYSLGGFPGVAENGNTAILVEIYRVTNKSVISRVNALEGYSGVRGSDENWYDTCDVETEWGLANMFTMNGLNGRGSSVITSGDWGNKTS
jgi:gamma-glutamylcyclotransferase (GGCT)/AIG2-like uncharacterized protein YtfP